MATGYEVGMYRDIARIAKALERIADVTEVGQYGMTKRELDSERRDLQPRSLGSSNTPEAVSADAPDNLSA